MDAQPHSHHLLCEWHRSCLRLHFKLPIPAEHPHISMESETLLSQGPGYHVLPPVPREWKYCWLCICLSIVNTPQLSYQLGMETISLTAFPLLSLHTSKVIFLQRLVWGLKLDSGIIWILTDHFLVYYRLSLRCCLVKDGKVNNWPLFASRKSHSIFWSSCKQSAPKELIRAKNTKWEAGWPRLQSLNCRLFLLHINKVILCMLISYFLRRKMYAEVGIHELWQSAGHDGSSGRMWAIKKSLVGFLGLC